jgi:hypothetical protein
MVSMGRAEGAVRRRRNIQEIATRAVVDGLAFDGEVAGSVIASVAQSQLLAFGGWCAFQ